NGIRDLKALALTQIISAVFGSIFSVLLIYIYGEAAIPASFLIFGFFSLVVSWAGLRKYHFKNVGVGRQEGIDTVKHLLKLGMGFCVSAVAAALFTYFARVYLNSFFNLETVGIYQACWIISNLYIGIILNAMSVDFMPRLMKVIDDRKKVNLQINEQMELGVLLSGIGVVGLVLFSELALTLLYSKEFVSGADIIRWQVLGVSLRVLGFPLAHTVMAFNKPVRYTIIQIVFAALEFGLLVLFTQLYGEDGLGISYFIAYIFFMILWYATVRNLSNFRLSKKLVKLLFVNWGFIFA